MQKRLSRAPKPKMKSLPKKEKIQILNIVNNMDCSQSIDRVRWSIDQFKPYTNTLYEDTTPTVDLRFNKKRSTSGIQTLADS